MKILKLRSKNIHSLKGEMLIDFTKEPLKSAGLFAITGVTGAGKSTILDVITLALFNKIPRFSASSSRSISKTEIEGIGSVVTHHCKDAYAEIEYQTGEKSYRSSWSIKKNRNGNFNDYEMCIADLNTNQILDLKRSEVPSSNEKNLGLTYDQFIRSVVLSQGDFARLLKSDSTERAQLLEDITGSRIYRKIGSKIFELSKEKEREIELLSAEVKGIECIPDEVANLKLEEIEQSKTYIEKLEITLKELNFQALNIEKKITLERSLNENNQRKNALLLRKHAFEDKDLRLDKHNKLNPYRDNFSTWKQNALRINQLQHSIQTTKTNLSTDVENQTKLIDAIGKFIQSRVNGQNALMELKAFEDRVMELYNQRYEIQNQGKHVRSTLDAFIDQNIAYLNDEITVHKNKHPEVLLPVIKNSIAIITSTPLALDGNVEMLFQKLEELQLEIKTLRSLSGKAEQYEALEKDIESLDKLINETQKDLENLPNEIASYKSQIQLFDKEIEAITLEKDRWIAFASMEEHRDKLEDGQPCPLCGAIHHPYAEDLPAKKVLNHEIKIMKIKEGKKAVEEALLKANNRKTELDSSFKIWTKQKHDDLLKMDALKGELQDQLSFKDLNIKIQHSESQESKTKEDIKKTQTLITLKTMENTVLRLDELMKEFKEKDIAYKAIYTGNNFKDEIRDLHEQFTKISDRILIAQTNLKTFSTDYEALMATQGELTAMLSDELKKLGYESIEFALQSILPDQVLQEWTVEKNEIQMDEHRIMTQLDSINSELSQLEQVVATQAQLDDVRLSIDKITKEIRDLMVERGKLYNELARNNAQKVKFNLLQTKIENLIHENEPLYILNHLIGDKEGNKYAKFAQNLNLAQLIHLTNIRLQKLTDRYLLELTDITADFKVIDLYQMNTVRSVKTLSGGETFIVSLALALSLSDMASKNVRLESLFIDEGFGSLDQESIEVALTTLEKLQSESNRSIGIISHVESLKERINTQIRVIKDSQGYSQIEII